MSEGGVSGVGSIPGGVQPKGTSQKTARGPATSLDQVEKELKVDDQLDAAREEAVYLIEGVSEAAYEEEARRFWGLSLPEPTLDDYADPAPFEETMRQLAGPETNLEALSHPEPLEPTQAISFDVGALGPVQDPSGEKLGIVPAYKEAEPPEEESGDGGSQDGTNHATPTEKELAQRLARLISYSVPEMDALAMQLTFNNLDLYASQVERGAVDAGKLVGVQEDLNQKEMEHFKANLDEAQKEAQKQMKTGLGRIFMGIGKFISGVLLGLASFDLAQIASATGQAMADLEMANYDPSKGNFHSIMKKVHHFNNLVPACWQYISFGVSLMANFLWFGLPGKLMKLISGIGKGISSQGGKAFLKGLLTNLSKRIVTVGKSVASGVKTTATSVVRGFKEAGKVGVKFAKGEFKSGFSAVRGGLKGLGSGLGAGIASSVQAAAEGMKSRETILAFSSAVYGVIKGVDDHAMATSQARFNYQMEIQDADQQEAETRYQQLTSMLHEVTDDLKEERMQRYQSSLSSGAEVEKAAADQRNQIVSRRI